MKTLVVFFSLEGNSEFIAGVIGEKLKADIVKLETVKPFAKEGFKKFFKGGMSVVFKFKPKLANVNLDLSEYDNIVIGTPVWAGGFSSPVNTFINKYKFTGKKVALFLTSGGPDVEKCYAKIKKALDGNEFVGEIDFIEPIKTGKDESAKKAEQWAESLAF